MEAQELQALIQTSVRETMREVLREERLALCLAMMPKVSAKEMTEIQAQFGSPPDDDATEFVDMTDWVRDEAELEQESP